MTTGQGKVKSVILGTAGHIDHGKSSLVMALTGIDPDRLKEEKERGITIDLGFANLAYADDLTVGIVDVPGHERLIRNMLAGAGGIDILMMVIAADEGVMPQSREHLAICGLLKIKAGIIALTKADLVDEEWLQLVADDIRGFVKGSFLENAEIVSVSSKTGQGIDILKQRIGELATLVQPKLVNGIFRLPIDRVFTLKGFGTVVTGTALSGTIYLDGPVEVLPAAIATKVRGLQSHGQSVDRAYAGQRVGVNLQGVDKDALRRGDVVVSPGRLKPTRIVDVSLILLSDAPVIKRRSLVHFYSGTAETLARVLVYDKEEVGPGESCYCKLRLEDPVVVLSGDRFIIRRFSPLETIGGGEVLDPHPIRRKRGSGIEDLIIFEKGNLKEKVEAKVKRSSFTGTTGREIEGWTQGGLDEVQTSLLRLVEEKRIVKVAEFFFHREVFDAFRMQLIGFLKKFHGDNPLKPGIPKEELKARLKTDQKISEKAFELLSLVGDVVSEKELVRHRDFKVALTTVDEGIKAKILTALNKGGFQPPFKTELKGMLSIDEKELGDLLKHLSKEGALVRISDAVFITKEQHARMIELLRAFFAKKPEMTVAEFRDILGTTRKYALPFLEYLDTHKITLRVGDIRKFVLK